MTMPIWLDAWYSTMFTVTFLLWKLKTVIKIPDRQIIDKKQKRYQATNNFGLYYEKWVRDISLIKGESQILS